MDVFSRLAPYIQDFIYRNNWTELRSVQAAACDVIFNSDDHLLLTSGTASGKTEAAFLPTLTILYESPSASVGILYVSPLKALINDQFVRLNALLEEGNIPVSKWHGDASSSEKNKLLKNPQGILQITPESLESLLINKREACIRLFKDLKFVIVDEVHAFMTSPRGTQLICLLERIEKLVKCTPRRIGLSATISDYDSAKTWLCSGAASSQCQVPKINGEKQKLALFMQRFTLHGDGTEKKEDSGFAAFYDFLYTCTLNKKTIIFANSRANVESVIANIRNIAENKKSPDIYRVHHGSISKTLRESAEKEMKTSELPIVTGATLTLELGIDIGSLDRIVQIGSPFSVSSLTQRIGRCGRKGQTSELVFAFMDSDNSSIACKTSFASANINWEFLKTIAIIQLRLEEKWVEPFRLPGHSFSLLYHQTMSFLLAEGEASPSTLAQNVLGLTAFQNIEAEDYKILLRHLVSINHLQKTDEGNLVIGFDAEPVVTGFDFYSVFESAAEYEVKHQDESIGSVSEAYPKGTHFVLAGRAWQTIEINEKAKIIFVTEAKGIPKISWITPTRLDIHTKILKKMRQILSGDDEYAYLSESCKSRLAQIRGDARQSGITKKLAVPLGGNNFAIFPWVGTRELYTLQLILDQHEINSIISPGGFLPIYLEAEYKGSEKELVQIIKNLLKTEFDPYTFDLPEKIQISAKFNQFIPEELLRKEFIEDYIDVTALKEMIF